MLLKILENEISPNKYQLFNVKEQNKKLHPKLKQVIQPFSKVLECGWKHYFGVVLMQTATDD